MRKSLASFLLAIAVSTGAPLVLGQEVAEQPAAEGESLEARVARLERENQELKATVMRRLPVAETAGHEERYYPIDAAGNAAGDANLAPDGEIRSVVEKVLAEQKAKEDAKKKADDLAGFEVGKDTSMTANWKNGVEITSKDKSFRLHVGGRYQFDGSAFSVDRSIQTVEIPGVGAPNHINTPYTDGVDFRRARFRMDGTMYENIEFAAEYDFINSNNYFTNLTPTNTGATPGTVGIFPQNPLPSAVTAPTDLWWTFTHLPMVGNIRVGNQKEAIGFEHLVSSRYLPFMERSYNQDTFYGGSFNGFIPGISMFNTMLDNRASWNIGVYKPAINVFSYNNINSDYSVTGRVTGLPYYVDEGRGLNHFGFSASYRTGYNDVYRYRTRDAIRSGISATWPVPADTGNIVLTSQTWLNTEFAAVRGPWTLQAEYLVDFSDHVRPVNNTTGVVGADHGTAVYHGGYVQLLCFLTGESDRYSFERAAFDRVVPFENFFLMEGEDCNVFGKGAWQVGARYDYLNLNSAGLNGGILNNFTAGLNWFLNPNMKIQFNYIATYRISDANVNVAVNRGGTGWINGWGFRVAQDF